MGITSRNYTLGNKVFTYYLSTLIRVLIFVIWNGILMILFIILVGLNIYDMDTLDKYFTSISAKITDIKKININVDIETNH